jgi:haloacetate dehalogenase
MFFPGFTLEHVRVGGGELRLRRGGEGPPLLLLHGNPQTHAMWHKVAPELAKRHTVYCPDLRGYGGSFKPPATPDHAPYAKREMARDMAELMTHFGHERFCVAAHDRGARVAHRLALDHPARVENLCVMDIIPTLEHFERADMRFGLGYYHWFWFAQPHPFPENVICAAPDAWWRAHTSREPKPPDFFAREALADYLQGGAQPGDDPRHVRGLPRGGDHRPRARPREPRGRGEGALSDARPVGKEGENRGLVRRDSIWKNYCAAGVAGGAVESGHYLAEEAPEEVLERLTAFLAA